MASSQVSTGLTSAYAGSSATALPPSSVVEHDEVTYGSSKPDPDPAPTPDPECCCKTINITLHFH